MAHVGNIDRGKGVVGEHDQLYTICGTKKGPPCQQGRQRTFQTPEIENFGRSNWLYHFGDISHFVSRCAPAALTREVP